MYKFLLGLFFVVAALAGKGQANYFIFIENTSKEPFSVKFNNVVVESGDKGFVTLNKVANGSYALFVSTETQKNKKFTIEVANADLGFSLKLDANNHLALFDENNLETIHQDGVAKINEIKVGNIIKDTKKEATDSIVKKVEKVVVPVATNIDTIVKVTSPKNDTIVAPKNNIIQLAPNIKKVVDKKNKEGINQIYIDINAKSIDTISIFIPFASKRNIDTIKEAKPVEKPTSTMVINNGDVVPNNCNKVATELDVVDFSKQLLQTTNNKLKLKVAAANFKIKCYTCNQIKRIGVLFAEVDAKVSFYKLSKKYLVDTQNFAILLADFSDESVKTSLINN
jgi:Domain of unknown function (DUF4476)